ncbi:transcriptional attenuator, LytR family [Marininema mesophilum]|uniref:Transcriptional attenuator, LytR family n=1 Tax=Marininema mesophilum TaxID=1048340 RepID=A0A1H3CAQ7_9BACL|nr:LCP family protein [Marininema mesophilum]SDX51272.1 transcriptional attenuator, LytR family [Marininema mesophilum]
MWILLSILLIIIIGVSYFFYKVSGAVNDSFDPLNRKSSKGQKDLTKQGSFTVLLVGTDVKDSSNQNWRSDTMILAAINPKKKTMKMVSIPRDTYAEIANANATKTKINAAPYYGIKSGVGPMTNTVYTLENFLNTPIKYYVKINFNGFMDITDTLGGVDVNVPFNFNMRLFWKNYTFKKGPAHLNGHEALAYVRFRKYDPRGDAGRNDRQREVVQNLMKQAISLNSIGKIDDILNAVGDNVNHNMRMSDMLELQSIYRSIPKEKIETLKFNGQNSRDNPQNLWYYNISDSERLRVSLELRKALSLPLQTLDGKIYKGKIPKEPASSTPGQSSSTTPQQPNSSAPTKGGTTTSP